MQPLQLPPAVAYIHDRLGLAVTWLKLNMKFTTSIKFIV